MLIHLLYIMDLAQAIFIHVLFQTDPVKNETTTENDTEISNLVDDKSEETGQGRKSKAQKRRVSQWLFTN